MKHLLQSASTVKRTNCSLYAAMKEPSRHKFFRISHPGHETPNVSKTCKANVGVICGSFPTSASSQNVLQHIIRAENLKPADRHLCSPCALYHTFSSCEWDHVTTFKSITQFTFPAVIHQPISPHPRRPLTELWALWWVGVGALEIYLSCCVQMVRCVWSAVLWFWGKHMAETVEQEHIHEQNHADGEWGRFCMH